MRRYDAEGVQHHPNGAAEPIALTRPTNAAENKITVPHNPLIL